MRLFYVIIAGIILFISGCEKQALRDKSLIRIKGSDTMLILVKQFAEAYMTINPGVSVYVEGGGSGTGFEALIEGDADIAMASRLITATEASRMAQTYKSIGVSYIVAKDALSIYLNPQNKIEQLTLGDLALIFSGEMKNWLIFNSTFGEIVPVIRPQSSGTHVYFKNHVLKDKTYSDKSISLPTTRDVVHFIAGQHNAIGYGGIAYSDSVYSAPVNGVKPTAQNVRDDSYPLSRYLYFYTVDIPDSQVRAFIDWVIGPAGQRIVKQVGYIPLWD